MRLATNAPGAWPPVYVEPEELKKGKAALLVAVENALKASPYRLESPDHPFPLAEGVVFADALVTRGDERWPLFVYPQATLEAAQGFYAAEGWIARHFPGYRPAVYYAPQPLPSFPNTGLGTGVLVPGFVFQATPFPRPGRYPMWRAARPGERFDLSPTWEAATAVFRRLRGREWVGLGVVLQAMGAAGHWREAEELKQRLFLMPLEGPGKLAGALSYRYDRGLRLHLHEATPPQDYAAWWRWFAGFLERFWPEDAPPAADASPAWSWWTGLLARLRATPAEMVGVVRLGDEA